MAAVPVVKLNNGYTIPVLGLGTWKSKPGEVEQAVKDAIDVGYRHIDCAHIYQNEKEVGDALQTKIADGTIQRDDVFLTSKLWNTFHKPELVEGALQQSLQDLGVDYLDLYLIHWPQAFQEGDDLLPKDDEEKYIPSPVDYVDTWTAMEALVEKGLVRSIGVSNFNKRQLERVLEVAKIKPQMLQRYAIDRGLVVIPKSVNQARIGQNFDVLDFQLTPEDVAEIASLECNGRLCSMGDLHHPDYPFHDEY